MNYLLEVCLVALALATSTTPSVAAVSGSSPWELFIRWNLGGENERPPWN